MNKTETAQLLAVASGYDRYIAVGPLNTTAWHLTLEQVAYQPAFEAVVDWYNHDWDGKVQLHPSVILTAVQEARLTPDEIAEDVRAARARGIIGAEWPEKEPLTLEARSRLKAARDADRAEAIKYKEIA